MDEKTKEMATGIIRDLVREEASLLRLEMGQVDHVMDHLGREMKNLEKTLRRSDGKRG